MNSMMFITVLMCVCLAVTVSSQALLCNFDDAVENTNTLPCTCDGAPCELTQMSSDDYNWLVWKGTTPSGATGPSDDHTLQNNQGLYIYAEASNENPQNTAVIETDTLRLGTMSCLRFWYHMNGQHMGSLNVTGSTTFSTSYNVWEQIGNQGNSWFEAVVSLPEYVNKVTFKATRGGSDRGMPYGDIALDDIRIDQELCPGVTTTTGSSTTTSTTSTSTRPTTTTHTPLSTSPSRFTTPTTTQTTTNPTTSTSTSTSTTSTSPTTTTTSSAPSISEQTSTSVSTGTISLSTSSSTHSTTTSTSTSTSTPTSTSTRSTSIITSTPTATTIMASITPVTGQQELWGLDETLWIIILCVAGAVILVLLVIVCVQACAMRRMRTARIVRQSDDYSNIEAYNKAHPQNNKDQRDNYINAYDNMGMDPEDKPTAHPNGGLL